MADGLSVGGSNGYSAIELAKARQATQLNQVNNDLQDIFDSAEAFKESQIPSSVESTTETATQSTTNTNAIPETSSTSASENSTSSDTNAQNQAAATADTSSASEGFRAKLAYPELFDRAVNNTAGQEQAAAAYQENQTISSLQDVFQSAVQQLLDAGTITASNPNQTNQTLSTLQETFQSAVEELTNTQKSETATRADNADERETSTDTDDVSVTAASSENEATANASSTDTEETRIQNNNFEEVQRAESQINQISRFLQDIYTSADAFRQSFAISA